MHMIKRKRRADAMTAINKSAPLFDGLVKILVSLVAFIYLFGVFWYPYTIYVIIYIILILGLFFRLFLNVNKGLPKWKLITVLFTYVAAMLDQVHGVFLVSGSISNVFTSGSVILISALTSAFILDLVQYIRTHTSE